jgi:UDP-N-acetylglucosamine 2-epimerase (non-hydrolysing)
VKVLVCWGTRPEKIKLEPVCRALAERGAEVRTFETVQSPDLLQGVQAAGVNWSNLSVGISSTLQSLRLFLQGWRPDVLLVQGDTATTFACALGGFLEGIPVGHVEAGMRTYAAEPWPEEAFRRMIAPLARWHFAPDCDAADNVENEGATVGVHVVGNTLIDVLPKQEFRVLVTLHRRENWGKRMVRALAQLDLAAKKLPSAPLICVITHPNWKKALEGVDWVEKWSGLSFSEPLPFQEFQEALRGATAVVTDSGGLQEECAHFGIPCFVFRTSTERTALQGSGAIQLIDPDNFYALYQALTQLSARRTAYGDGTASQKIADILTKEVEV